MLRRLSELSSVGGGRRLIHPLSLRGGGLGGLEFAVSEFLSVASLLERDLTGRDARVAVDGRVAFLRVFQELLGRVVFAFVSLLRGGVLIDGLFLQAANGGDGGGLFLGQCLSGFVTQLLGSGTVMPLLGF